MASIRARPSSVSSGARASGEGEDDTQPTRTGKAGSASPTRRPAGREGWEGWDDYAPFYDWENAQTIGRSDVPFWLGMAARAGGPVLELGCGTGRVSLPIARRGVPLVGVDRSEKMLARLRGRLRRARSPVPLRPVRGDIRFLPFTADAGFRLVMAPYGILQSLLEDEDLAATLDSVAAVTRPGTTFGIDLVADLPSWKEYTRRVRLRGRRGRGDAHLTLVESVRQDPARGLTIFDQEYVERRGSREETRVFSLAFRTVSVPEMADKVRRAGFDVTAVLGDYDGRPWDPRAEVWVILARRR